MRANPWQSTADRGAESVIPPGRTRRNTLVRQGLVLAALAVIAYAPSVGYLARRETPGAVAVYFATFGGLLISIVPLIGYGATWPARRGTDTQVNFMTAKTATGWRTVDLSRLATIRYRTVNRYRSDFDFLLVRDANRVCLGVRRNDGVAIGWLRDAVLNSPHPVRRSRAACAALGVPVPRDGIVRDGFSTLYGLLLWAATLAVYGAVIALVVPNT
jgi:hypothetical protein